jgi:hypothetical protein
MNRRPHLALLATATAVVAGLVTGCGGGTPGSPSEASKATGGSPAATAPAHGTGAGASAGASTAANGGAQPVSAQPTVPPRTLNAALGVTAVQIAADIAPDGSARDARTVFHASSDHRVVAVLSLAGLKAGTRVSFVRWLDGRFLDTRGSALQGSPSHFYFEFTAAAGKPLTPGTYRLRIYVDGAAAAETSYQVV